MWAFSIQPIRNICNLEKNLIASGLPTDRSTGCGGVTVADPRRPPPIDLPPEITAGLPPSALLCYVAMRELEGPAKINEVVQWTGMSQPTARRGMTRLVDAGVAEQRQARQGHPNGHEFVLSSTGST